MSKQTLSIDQLASFLQDGDALINCTNEAIAATVPALSINSDGTARLINGPAYPVNGDANNAMRSLNVENVTRFVIVADGESGKTFETACTAANLPHITCVVESSCDAGAFMDEEDSEAVAERLRQLGYL